MFQQVKTLVSCKSACETYNIKLYRKGFALCLFHADSKPSMKIYDGSRGFYCFSCGAKGDVIDLVGKIFGCDNKQACIQISHDFNLNITTKKPNRKFFIQLQQKKILEERKKIQEKNKDLLFRFLYFRFHRLKPKEKFEELSDEFIRAMLELNKIELEV